MKNQKAQQDELDQVLSGMDALDDLDALDFDVEEVTAGAEQEADQAEEIVMDADDDAAAEIEVEVAAQLEDEQAEEPEIDESIEADIKAQERERKLREATMTEEEIEASKAKSSKAGKSKPKRAAVAAGPREPSEAIDVAALIASKVQPSLNHWQMLPGMDTETAELFKAELESQFESLPKKTREKAVNLMDWFVRGRSLSVFVGIAFDVLSSQGEIKPADLRNRYQSNPGKAYTQGTANAQTGQVMQILRTFQIIDSDGKANPKHAMFCAFKERETEAA